MLIRPVATSDSGYLADIYGYYVRNTTVSFEIDSPSSREMLTRMAAYTEIYPWLVCETEEGVVGYAYASRYKDRPSYRYTDRRRLLGAGDQGQVLLPSSLRLCSPRLFSYL